MSVPFSKDLACSRACKRVSAILAHLQMHISNVLAERHSSLPVNDLHSDGRIALGFEHIVDQVLGRKIYVAAAVRVVLTQHALWIEAAQAPAGEDTWLGVGARA